MQVETIDGKPVIVVHVPEADVSQKPGYFKATGLPGGAYRRIGSANQRCADEDLWVLRGETQPQSGPDMAPMQDATRADLDPEAIAEYTLAGPRAPGEDSPEQQRLPFEPGTVQLKPMREDGQLELRYPESIKHPHHAYYVPEPEQEKRRD